MTEQRSEKSMADSMPPPPNFDDVVATLSARPVVPLKAIESKVMRRRRLVLGGAFALSVMLGAASALLVSYIKLPYVAGEISAVEVESKSLAVTPSVTSDSSDDEEFEEAVVPVRVKRTVKSRSTDRDSSRGGRKLSEEEQLRRIRDAVLFDEWQEQRQRRVERREKRNRDNDGGRDLSKLDEIFEGPRRP